MTLTELLSLLDARGVTVRVHDNRLQISPARVVQDLVEDLKTHKPDLIQFLHARGANSANANTTPLNPEKNGGSVGAQASIVGSDEEFETPEEHLERLLEEPLGGVDPYGESWPNECDLPPVPAPCPDGFWDELSDVIDWPDPCPHCGSLDFSWSPDGKKFCRHCDPPLTGLRLAERTLRRQKRKGGAVTEEHEAFVRGLKRFVEGRKRKET